MRRSCRLRSASVVGFAWALLAIADGPACAQAASRNLMLEVFINGDDTGKIASFFDQDGGLFVKISELRSLGLDPPQSDDPDALIDVATLVIIPPSIDERAQTIALNVPLDRLAVQNIEEGNGAAPPLFPSSAPPFGVLVNYDVTATQYAGSLDVYGFTSMRLFGRFGTIQNDVSLAHARSLRAVRLNTTYSYSDPRRARTFSVGDIVSGALPYSRSFRLGGLQMSTNFSLRPDLITYPVPIVSGGAAVPSTVDIFVNGVRQLSAPLAAGPFTVPKLPVVNGAGQVTLAVRDAAGRQTVQTSSFYISPSLLKPGLSSLSLEAGAIRRGFALENSSYGPLAIIATGRRGISPSLTLDGLAQFSGQHALIGGGATASINALAIASASIVASKSQAGLGWQSYISVARTTPSYHFGISAIRSSNKYRDIGVAVGDLPPRRSIQTDASIILGRQGSFGISYTNTLQGRSLQFTDYQHKLTKPSRRASLVSANYSREVFGRAYLYITAFNDLGSKIRAITAGLSFRFGKQSAATASYDSGSDQAIIDASRPALQPGDLAWHAYASQGSNDRYLGELSYRASEAEVSVGIDRYVGKTAIRASGRGSLVLLGQSVFASTSITDGFVLVDTNGFSGVAVAVNNRPAGRTSKSGKLLVPGLVSYQANKISIDPDTLPINAQWDNLESSLIPSDRSGLIASFGLKRQRQALISIRLADGQPLPVGSQVSSDDSPETVSSGFDGQVFFTDFKNAAYLRAVMPDGTRCRAATSTLPLTDWPIRTDVVCNK